MRGTRIVMVKANGHIYEIPEMWLVGSQCSGRTFTQAVSDWIIQTDEFILHRRIYSAWYP